MKASKFYTKDQEEILSVINSAKENIETDINEEYDSVKQFFKEYGDVDYNTFLITYDEKYGQIIKQYRERQKIKSLKVIKIAAILYIITFGLGVMGVLIYVLPTLEY